MIIGIAGKNCAGKDTAADFLKKMGFAYLSLSDAIRDELAHKGIEPTRTNLIEAGTRIREQFGSGELARRICKKIEPGKDYVIVSIRNPEEVRELEKLGGFYMVEICADEKARFERMKSRGRPGDPKTLEEFLSAERAEEKNENSAAQQLGEVSKMASQKIENSSGVQSLGEKITALVGDLREKEGGAKNS